MSDALLVPLLTIAFFFPGAVTYITYLVAREVPGRKATLRQGVISICLLLIALAIFMGLGVYADSQFGAGGREGLAYVYWFCGAMLNICVMVLHFVVLDYDFGKKR